MFWNVKAFTKKTLQQTLHTEHLLPILGISQGVLCALDCALSKTSFLAFHQTLFLSKIEYFCDYVCPGDFKTTKQKTVWYHSHSQVLVLVLGGDFHLLQNWQSLV